jgi:hypothetical protein
MPANSSRSRRRNDPAPPSSAQYQASNYDHDPARLYKILEKAFLDIPTPAEVRFLQPCLTFCLLC